MSTATSPNPRSPLGAGLLSLACLLTAFGAWAWQDTALHPALHQAWRQAICRMSDCAVAAEPPLHFESVRSVAQLEHALRAARTQGRGVLLHVQAQWCAPCQDMLRHTFSDPALAARLSRLELLQVDVSADRLEDRAMLQHLRLFGPSALLLFSSTGEEAVHSRVVGAVSPSALIKRLDQARL